MKLIKFILSIALSIIVGGLIGFIAMLVLSELLFFIGTSAIVATILSSFVYAIAYGKDLSRLITVFTFVITFVLYFCLLALINSNQYIPAILALISFIAPYMFLAYFVLVIAKK